MAKKLPPEQLTAIWKALNEPAKSQRQGGAFRLISQIAEKGWASFADIEDIFYLTDVRLDNMRHQMDVRALCDLFEIPVATVFYRPKSKQASVSGFKGVSAADTAELLICMECLGFTIDPEQLVYLLNPSLKELELLTQSQLSVFWFHKTRHKSAPVSISVDGEWRRVAKTVPIVTSTGYKATCWLAEDGSPLRLEVRAPKFRQRPSPVRETCAICGYEWYRGDTDSSAAHRRAHKERLQYLDPVPVERFLAERTEGKDAELVTGASPPWKHREIYRRAVAFKREFGYDFVQWHSPKGDDDPGVQGLLFSNAEGIIVGACAFRLRENKAKRWTGLQWIWIAPKFRRAGILTAQWPELRRRFGDFHVEGPVSEAMQAFLEKVGDAHLMGASSSREVDG